MALLNTYTNESKKNVNIKLKGLKNKIKLPKLLFQISQRKNSHIHRTRHKQLRPYHFCFQYDLA